ncbi:hypothetical protein Tco_1328388 [Tanacetum coccineum]|uniref:Uncharacterized protein n=1 Tax=Tanacetum coccineum TaxID=301880 RepID=A0ABQ5A1G9_9ASTR
MSLLEFQLSAGHSSPPSYCADIQHLNAILQDLQRLPSYSLGSSRNGECSNCKHLRGKISVLKETIGKHMHRNNFTVNSACLFLDVLNENGKN